MKFKYLSLVILLVFAAFLAFNCGGGDTKEAEGDNAAAAPADPMPEGNYKLYSMSAGEDIYKHLFVYDNGAIVYMAGTQIAQGIDVSHMTAFGGIYKVNADGSFEFTIKMRASNILEQSGSVYYSEWKPLKKSDPEKKLVYTGKLEDKGDKWVISGIKRDGAAAFPDGDIEDGEYIKSK